MTSSRQLLINKLFKSGIGLTGSTIDNHVKQFNEFKMPLSQRLHMLTVDEEEYQRFLRYIETLEPGLR